MANNSKRKLLFTALFLMILLVSIGYIALIPNVQAAEVTVQQKGLAVMSNVVGLDLAKYATSSTDYPQDSFLGVAPQEDVVYAFESNSSRVKSVCTFTNGALQILHVLEKEGTPILTKAVNTARNMAKDFLGSYQSLSGDSFYGELSSTLNNVDDSKNSTTTFGNVKLEVTTSENGKTFVWSYTFNGVNAACKCVSLMYKDGFLKYFVDTWDLYKVGSTKVSISEEEAVAIAMERAKAYSWKVGLGNDTVEINNFTVTKAMEKRLVFCNSINADNARGEDRFMLYPMWRIGVGLDKYYPGDVFGIYVDVWADTGEIRDVREIVSPIPPPESELATIEDSTLRSVSDQSSEDLPMQNSPSINWTALLSPFAVILVTTPIWLTKKHNLPKRQFLKIASVLLCFFVGFSILSFSVPDANAIVKRATVWGSWAQVKSQEEMNIQQSVCSYINGLFYGNSYVATNYQGDNTRKNFALNQFQTDEQNYECVATVWFDHGIGHPWNFPGGQNEWHFRLCDSTSAPYPPYPYPEEYPDPCNPGMYNWQTRYIYDFEIFDATQGLGKTFFAFISTCMSARLNLLRPDGQPLAPGITGTYGPNQGGSGHPIGMPYAWTHCLTTHSSAPPSGYMSDDGYGLSDSGPFCYIGFPWGSPALYYYVEHDYPNKYYFDWVEWFFIYALNPDFSVNQALDQASLHCFSKSFGQTDLRNGFISHWPPQADQGSCTMAVYGNGNIRLKYYDPSVDSVGRPTVTGPSQSASLEPYAYYTFTATAADSQDHDIHYLFDWGDGTYSWVPGEGEYSPNGEPVQTSHSWSPGGYQVTVSAQCENGQWNTGAAVWDVHVGNWYWLYVYTVDGYYGGPVNGNICVDGIGIGGSYGEVFLPEGWHYISVDYESSWENGPCYYYGDNPLWIYLDGTQWEYTLIYW